MKGLCKSERTTCFCCRTIFEDGQKTCPLRRILKTCNYLAAKKLPGCFYLFTFYLIPWSLVATMTENENLCKGALCLILEEKKQDMISFSVSPFCLIYLTKIKESMTTFNNTWLICLFLKHQNIEIKSFLVYWLKNWFHICYKRETDNLSCLYVT